MVGGHAGLIRYAVLVLALVAAASCSMADAVFVSAPGLSATFERADQGVHIVAPGYSSITSPGDPAMPFAEIFVVLPPNTNRSSVSASLAGASVTTLDGVYDIAPAPPAAAVVDGEVVFDWGKGKQIESGRNTLVYGRDEFYPSTNAEVIDVGRMRKWIIARVRYYPYRFNPVSGAVELASDGLVQVSYSLNSVSTTSAALMADAVLDDFAGSMAANFDEARAWYRKTGTGIAESQPSAQSATSDYVIITTSSIVSGSAKLQDFVNHKSGRGFSVEVVTQAQWGGGTGDAAAENIRAYLKANYIAKGIRYVLLVGDPHPTTGTVPMKMLWPRRNYDTYREAPSDYYYADLTGNWDLDGDGYYGEQDNDFGPGGIDIYPEVIVGRIPFYGNYADLDSILQKTISYESGAFGAGWTNTVLVSMEPSDDSTPGYHLGEAIKKDAATPAGLSTRRVYEQTYGLNPPADYIPCNYDNVLAAWQQKAGFHFWWTHGSATSAADVFTSSRCQYLDNNYPSFTFQSSCLNGYPEVSDNLGYSLLKRGAIATDSASRVSWYYPGQTAYTNTDSNAGMTYRYAVKLIRDRLACGDAHFQMMTAVPKVIWMNHCVFNIYGDPSVAYITRPGIEHTPLPDTDNNAAPYVAQAVVTSSIPLASGSPTIRWNTDGGSVFSSILMTRQSGDIFTAGIPPQPYGTTVYYYIHAQDTAGQYTTNPPGGAFAPYTFQVAPDLLPPVILHTPLTDTSNTTGPYRVSAAVTDERGIASVTLFYSINGGPESALAMPNVGANTYEAGIPGPTNAGDLVSYRIEAVDASVSANIARHPHPSGYHSFAVTNARAVAILNSSSVPSYFFGGNNNTYSMLRDILASDPAQRFLPMVLTSLTTANLADIEALVLPDNGVAVADLQSVAAWFGPDKVILAMDSAICYAAYSGFMWPGAAGANGYGTLWDYSAGQNDQLIWLADPITRGYTVGQVIESKAGDAQMYTSKLAPDAVALTGRTTNSDRCYAAYRDVPGKGRIVVLGPFITPTSGQYSMIRDALAVPIKTVRIAEAKRIPDGRDVRLVGKVVTHSAGGDCYVQEPDGSAGIKVRWSAGLAPASLVTVEGTMTSVHGERAIDAMRVGTEGSSSSVSPRSMRTDALGGAKFGLQQPVMEYRLVEGAQGRVDALLPSRGLNNVGILVRVFGRVTGVGPDFFYIDDGCGCSDGSGESGVRVLCGAFPKPAVGQFAVVTAVSSTYFDRGSLFRALMLPAEDCVRVVSP